MLVKAEGVDFGRLAGGVLARAREKLDTDLDAVGDAAVSNAVKAVALANELLGKERPGAIIGFLPKLAAEEGEGGRKLVRLTICSLEASNNRSAADGSAAPLEQEQVDFSRGGIYVPVDAATAGRRGAASRAQATGDGADGTGVGVATPTELAKTVLGEWLRFAAPALRAAARAAAASRAAGGPAMAAASSASAPGRQRAPFLFTIGPAAVSRAVKALAFVCSDLQKPHLAGSPAFIVVPRFGERCTRDKFNGLEKTTKFVALCLARAGAGRGAAGPKRPP